MNARIKTDSPTPYKLVKINYCRVDDSLNIFTVMYVQIQVFCTLNLSGRILEQKASNNIGPKRLGPCNMIDKQGVPGGMCQTSGGCSLC